MAETPLSPTVDVSFKDDEVKRLAKRVERVDAMWALLVRLYGEDRLLAALNDETAGRPGETADA